MTHEICAYCGKEFDLDTQSPFGDFNCSYHPKKPQSIGNAGPKGDYAELWIFPCCGKRLVGEIVDGRDVVPRQSPGCINCFHSTKRAVVFISYSRSDRQFVEFLERELQRRGYNLWRDTSDLVASEDWQEAINEALDTCSHFVLVLSKVAATRPEVNRELGAAAHAKKPIIPILLADCDLPAWIRRLNYIDWRKGQDSPYSVNFHQLEEALADPARLQFLNRIRLGSCVQYE